MDIHKQKRCETHLLDDLPAHSDAFTSDGDVGPHQRVADAIAELIESDEEGGKAIGLEGSWGSGKSTVVRLLIDRFSKNDNQTVVLFDAWAHEGDPLRRTFIESIVKELCEYSWADKRTWKKRLDELANRRKKTQTLTTPNTTFFGTLAAIALLLIPLGTAFTNAGLRKGVSLDFNRSVNAPFAIGLILVLFPFWILIARSIYVIFKERRCPMLADFAFLTKETVSETQSETIESPNPTSLEFDEYFCSLMSEALSDRSHKLLLVLDNLDRVDAETALSIWGTLQTFLHDRDHNSEEWCKQLWVVVPYDPIRIRKLWNQPEEQNLAGKDENSNGTREAIRTTESFLDKSFQVRFHVAPPVLSGWKSFLCKLVEMALPAHKEQAHVIYRVFDQCQGRKGVQPTPRELKLYVNQIGAIHRQWQHEFPIGHIAFFVLARKNNHRLLDDLREGKLPTEDDYRLLDGQLKGSLAGLAFNVKAPKGLELLLANTISEALKSSDSTELTTIAERNGDGFWAVLEIVATTRWHDEDASGIAAIASQLSALHLFDEYEGPEKEHINSSLKNAAVIVKTWMPVVDQTGTGIANLLALQRDPEFTAAIVKRFCNQLAKDDVSKQSASTIFRELFRILAAVQSLGHDESIPKSLKLPFNAEGWIEACNEIAKHDPDGNYWKRLRPSSEFNEISTSLVSTISSGAFSASHIAALKVTDKCTVKCDWKEICNAIQTRLYAEQNASTSECYHLLYALFELEAVGEETAISAQQALSKSGHIVHHFHQAKKLNDTACQAAIILSLARRIPGLTKPVAVGNSEVGHQLLIQAIDSPEEDVVSELYVLAKRFDFLPQLLIITEAAGEYRPFFVEALKLVADSETPQDVFTPQIVIEKWNDLRRHLIDDSNKVRFQKLVGKLAVDHGLCEWISDSENGFNRSDASLYLYIVRGAQGRVPDFLIWCRERLRRLTEEEWIADLTGQNSCCALCIELSRQGHPPSLASGFTDALQDHANSVVKGEGLPADWIRKSWSTLLNCIEEESTRKVLRDRLIETAVAADGQLSDEFFDMYGTEIAESSALAAIDKILTHFFTSLVRERHIRGLAWLDKFSSDYPDFLGIVRAEHTVKDFTDRLQELVDEPSDDETQVSIDSIAAHFGIERRPEPEEHVDDESAAVEKCEAANEDETSTDEEEKKQQ